MPRVRTSAASVRFCRLPFFPPFFPGFTHLSLNKWTRLLCQEDQVNTSWLSARTALLGTVPAAGTLVFVKWLQHHYEKRHKNYIEDGTHTENHMTEKQIYQVFSTISQSCSKKERFCQLSCHNKTNINQELPTPVAGSGTIMGWTIGSHYSVLVLKLKKACARVMPIKKHLYLQYTLYFVHQVI